jgi:hypothetical protein
VSTWAKPAPRRSSAAWVPLGKSLATAAEKQWRQDQAGLGGHRYRENRRPRHRGHSSTQASRSRRNWSISSADPTTTFRRSAGLPPDGSGHGKAGGALSIAKRHRQSSTLHLSALPSFTASDEAQLAERLVITPSMDSMETALNPMKYRELSDLHTFDISIPTALRTRNSHRRDSISDRDRALRALRTGHRLGNGRTAAVEPVAE